MAESRDRRATRHVRQNRNHRYGSSCGNLLDPGDALPPIFGRLQGKRTLTVFVREGFDVHATKRAGLMTARLVL